ncbi:glucose dehydrogenase [FAD, quinone]-like [Phlebotomus argentipes]|uniref:glucose dehydrogenase [FAD, quinone]-like n=1 Tax=Phlebotomus argentipes TaxID=94469 RepID=UPI0028936E54|nr:glucose dehydrogenase [FAD, quinone]-like [Phlebotomus argentipes]XP_059620689.1 glucose dehydrogenase [FAD, quinone]-like [Phlebotomus argentipes]XP_059622495.1 glucose dehydrogenase [FAD, quinone]-like [Phlebotomus argentipes]
MWKFTGISFILIHVLFVQHCECQHGQVIIDSVFSLKNFLEEGGQRLTFEQNNYFINQEYDFIIVGAGSAGCVLANRLTENKEWKVLLLEAGPRENLLMDVPMFVHYLQQTNADWHYKTESSNGSCLAMNNNQCKWPRGKVMGGSSVLNYMIYTRGNRRDYDRWAAMGNPGWSWNDVHPYFQKLEKSFIRDAVPGYLGTDGPMSISYPNWHTKIAKAFIKAGLENGASYVDYNGPTQVGYSYFQTTTENGLRKSANVAYIYPIRGTRSNLHIKKESFVTKILIDPATKRAYGVQFVSDKKLYQVFARKEVILSAGTINTPQLMMLSGIGPGDHLREHGITPLMDLAVGYNLMDHTAVPIALTVNISSMFIENIATVPNLLKYESTRKGPISSIGACEAVAFYDFDNPTDPDGWPDIELFQIGGTLYGDSIYRDNFNIRTSIYATIYHDMERRMQNGFQIWPMILRPKSRGRITLRDTNPFSHPRIHANYFSDPRDVRTVLRGVRKVQELAKMPSLAQIDAKLIDYDHPVPTCAHHGVDSDNYWDCVIRHLTLTIYHYSGTCKMGPPSDPTAVVDPRLRVYGISNLRVIDASIIPEIPAGHTNGPTLMIAERAADFIKEDWNYAQ